MEKLNKQIATEARRRSKRRDFKDGCERLAFYVYGLNMTDRLLFMMWFKNRSDELTESRRLLALLRESLMRALNGVVDFDEIERRAQDFRQTLDGLETVSGPVALLASLDRAVEEERINDGKD